MSSDPDVNDENETKILLQSIQTPEGSEAETPISPSIGVGMPRRSRTSTTTAEKPAISAEADRASEISHQKPEFEYNPPDEDSQREVTDNIEKLVARMEHHWKQSEKPHPSENPDTFPTDSLREILAGVSKCQCDELAALLVWSGWTSFQQVINSHLL